MRTYIHGDYVEIIQPNIEGITGRTGKVSDAHNVHGQQRCPDGRWRYTVTFPDKPTMDFLEDALKPSTEEAYLMDFRPEQSTTSTEVHEEQPWIPVSKGLPKKPGLHSYEHVPCAVAVKHSPVPVLLLWNCEHLCWDDSEGDDISPLRDDVTHYIILPKLP